MRPPQPSVHSPLPSRALHPSPSKAGLLLYSAFFPAPQLSEVSGQLRLRVPLLGRPQPSPLQERSSRGRAPKVRTGARAAGGSTEKHKEEPEEGTHSPPAGHCRPPDGCPPEHLCLGQTSVRALTRTHGTFNCHPDPSRRSFWPRLTDGQSEAQRRRIPGSS